MKTRETTRAAPGTPSPAFAILLLLLIGCSTSEPVASPDAGLEPPTDSGPHDVSPTAGDSGAPTLDAGTIRDASSPSDASHSANLTWIAIPSGTFQMGCSPGDTECYDAEAPRHSRAISAFEINDTEVTQGQYEAVTGINPSEFLGCATCPVDTVSWTEARAFCGAVGGRLPSEAEWEYAARAGATTRYHCGDDPSCLDTIAWTADNSGNETHPVAEKTPNAFGLHDTAGNVWEWIEDCWHNDYGAAPADGRAWVEPDCEYRVARGGNWGLGARGLRVSNRDGDYPDSYLLPAPGFRCARDQ